MTIKVLLTIPFRAVPGLVMLLFCGIILFIGVVVKAICEPREPVFDYNYRYYIGNCSSPAKNVEWLDNVKWWYKWIVFGSQI